MGDFTMFIKGDRAPADIPERFAPKITVAKTQFGDVTILDLQVEHEAAGREMDVGGISYIRLLDRFYLPVRHDAATTDAFFARIADDYETLIDAERNIQNLINLIGQVAGDGAADRDVSLILDFGCGTGLSVVALSRMNTPSPPVTLVGFDRCAKMREVARQRGLNVLPLAICGDLRTAGAFSGVIASYVFHFGVDVNCFKALHDSLIAGGLLALNFHKATGDELHELDARAGAAGFRLKVRYDDPEHGSISVFRA